MQEGQKEERRVVVTLDFISPIVDLLTLSAVAIVIVVLILITTLLPFGLISLAYKYYSLSFGWAQFMVELVIMKSEFPAFTDFIIFMMHVNLNLCLMGIILHVINAKKLWNGELLLPVRYNLRQLKEGNFFECKKGLEFGAAFIPYSFSFGSLCNKCNTKRTWNADGCCEHCKYKIKK
jgi:hypothetical protein